MNLSIIIVNWNGLAVLEKCLDSINRNRDVLELEVIVVDNASTDGSPRLLKDKFAWVKLLENSNNLGFSAATNQGLRVAAGPYFLLLNNDTEVLPGALTELVNYLEENRDIGAVGGMLLYADGTPQLSYGYFPNTYALLARYLLCDVTPQDNKLINELKIIQPSIIQEAMNLGCTPKQWDYPKEVGYVSGACLMTRREVLDRVGYLDESFFAYFEDTDWCLRVKQKGWRVVFCSYGRVVHHLSTSFQATGQKESFFLRSMLIYITKHFGREAAIEARDFLNRVFCNKVIYFSRLARKKNNGNYEVKADEYRRLITVLWEDENP